MENALDPASDPKGHGGWLIDGSPRAGMAAQGSIEIAAGSTIYLESVSDGCSLNDQRIPAGTSVSIVAVGGATYSHTGEANSMNPLMAGLREMRCGDGVDNDEDGDADCADEDCAGPSCDEICDNLLDDDLDGAPDCQDSGCVGHPYCLENGTHDGVDHCTDLHDNDIDAQVDCADLDCHGDPACPGTCNAAQIGQQGNCAVGETCVALDSGPTCVTNPAVCWGEGVTNTSMLCYGYGSTSETCNPDTDLKIHTCGSDKLPTQNFGIWLNGHRLVALGEDGSSLVAMDDLPFYAPITSGPNLLELRAIAGPAEVSYASENCGDAASGTVVARLCPAASDPNESNGDSYAVDPTPRGTYYIEDMDTGNPAVGSSCCTDEHCGESLKCGADHRCFDADEDDDGYTVDADCDDHDPDTHPDASDEGCDGVDDDCDGTADDDYASSETSCGTGACAATGSMTCVEGVETDTCTAGEPSDDSSCDGVDDDCDGTADDDYASSETSCGTGACAATGSMTCVEGVETDTCTAGEPQAEICDDGVDNDCDESDLSCDDVDDDGDGTTENGGDCDDGNASVYPGATESCNGADDDCNGAVDEVDADGDGYSVCSDDCNDADAGVSPAASEACDLVDNDCNGAVDDGFDADGDGWTTCLGDCDDAAGSIHPLMLEACNAVDDNCSGTADELFDIDADGQTTCGGDCNDLDAGINSAATEICDGIDNNCDASSDEGYDQDGDGFTTCLADCDDANAERHPGAADVCDGTDNDCDGTADEGFDADGDGYTSCGGDCNDSNAAFNPGAEDPATDGVDQNCDAVSEECPEDKRADCSATPESYEFTCDEWGAGVLCRVVADRHDFCPAACPYGRLNPEYKRCEQYAEAYGAYGCGIEIEATCGD